VPWKGRRRGPLWKEGYFFCNSRLRQRADSLLRGGQGVRFPPPLGPRGPISPSARGKGSKDFAGTHIEIIETYFSRSPIMNISLSFINNLLKNIKKLNGILSNDMISLIIKRLSAIKFKIFKYWHYVIK